MSSNMFTSFAVVLLFAFARGATEGGSDDEIPFVVASQGSPDEKVSNLLPDFGTDVPTTFHLDNRGRGDIEIVGEQDEGERPFVGYFYPKPGKAFELPAFKTLDADATFGGDAGFAPEGSAEGLGRPQRSSLPNIRSLPPLIPLRYF